MDILGYVVLVGFVVLAVYLVVIYNNLVALKHNVSKAWSNIEVLLKQRHDELPKLVEVCKQYMHFEQTTLDKVMQGRALVSQAQGRGDMAALGEAETQLRLGLGQLFAVAESYPELSSNDRFRHLQHRISGLENAIADRREYYNESVNANNVRIEQFPDVFIARTFSFQPMELLNYSDEELRDVNLKELFS